MTKRGHHAWFVRIRTKGSYIPVVSEGTCHQFPEYPPDGSVIASRVPRARILTDFHSRCSAQTHVTSASYDPSAPSYAHHGWLLPAAAKGAPERAHQPPHRRAAGRVVCRRCCFLQYQQAGDAKLPPKPAPASRVARNERVAPSPSPHLSSHVRPRPLPEHLQRPVRRAVQQVLRPLVPRHHPGRLPLREDASRRDGGADALPDGDVRPAASGSYERLRSDVFLNAKRL